MLNSVKLVVLSSVQTVKLVVLNLSVKPVLVKLIRETCGVELSGETFGDSVVWNLWC